MGQTPREILKQYWNHDSFRPLQEDIIQSVLAGKDTLALLPTGGGKSLCFQVPAMARPGLCLVVSPLISLMKDQTDRLRRKGITAFALYAGMSRKDVLNIFQVAGDSNCKFLYVSPERLETALFLEYLPSLPINLIAVDEAHCVSQWGYDFRPPYLRIAALREQVEAPVLALTASATPEVMKDIADKLQLRQPAVFRSSFTRANLSYSYFSTDAKVQKAADILQKVPGSSIIYCNTRRASKEISEQLNRLSIPAGAYHAGLSREERNTIQDAWIKDRQRVIVATNAFGMGIDKPDVRTVIHFHPPESVENYYQEAGRAGRDGAKAYAILLSDGQDRVRLKALPDTRYPPMEKIWPVYQQLMNFLQLPVGSGEGNYYDFDLARFTEVFSIDTTTTLNVIKTLEQEGLMSYQQQVFLPSSLRFTTAKQALYDFEHDHPALQPLIHTLLRTYEGIFERPTPIKEKQLAFLTGKDISQVTKELLQLQSFHLVDYTPQKDTPQVYFSRERPAAEDLYIDPVGHRLRKEQYAARIHSMMRYMDLSLECRSRWLANYFGDREAKDCGICDNCRKAGRKAG
ncbi:MAG TPA: ATP-dependent DNA helicase RecQ [Puia sp.]|nr:ATP-dependent DNA helicase RecQ [Puia sp.]